MKLGLRMAAVAVITALSAACGPGQTPVAHVTPTSVASSSPTPSAAPAAGLCDTAHRCLALVTLSGSSNMVVRDVTDIDHPVTVNSFAAVSDPSFVSGTELSYVDYGDNALVRTPLAGSPRTVVASSTGFAGYVAWSPDGGTVVYVTASPDSQEMTIHQKGKAPDHVFATIPRLPGVGCESYTSCPTDIWDVELLYSRDGRFVAYVNSVIKPAFRLWSADGTLLKSTDMGQESMPVWSGQSFYFRDAAGVEVWRGGVVTAFLPGIAWIRPKASADGRLIVYQTRDAQHWSHVYVVDTATRGVRDLGSARSSPVFLTARYVWYRGERACAPADGCGPNLAGVPSGKTYIYDLQTGAEYPSIVTNVYDVWPHAA